MMTKKETNQKYWAVESKSYMKHFQERCKDRFESRLQKLINNCAKAAEEPPHLKFWKCFRGTSYLGMELSLKLIQCYLKDDWPSYLTYRQLVEKIYSKIIEWALAAEDLSKNGLAFDTVRIGMINHVVLPLILGGKDTQTLPTFQIFLNIPEGTSTNFCPDLTDTFSLMVEHKLAQSSLPVIERFEPENIYEHLAWRYKYCLKPSNEVDYALTLMPEELIAYHIMREKNVDENLLSDNHFVQMQSALDAIRSGQAAKIDDELLIEALHRVSDLESAAYQEIGKEVTRLDTLLELS